MVKPLSFGDEKPAAPAVKSSGPKPLDFASAPPVKAKPAPPASPPVQRPAPLSFEGVRVPVKAPPPPPAPPVYLETGGQWVDGRLVMPPDPPTAKPAGPTKIDPQTFRPTPVKPPAREAGKAMFGDSRSPATLQAIENIKKQYPDIYRAEATRIDVQLRQLLPLTLDVVMNWGTKTLERMRDGSKDGMALVGQFSQSNGNDMMQKVMEAMQPASGFLARFKQQDPGVYEAPLSALGASLSMWIPACSKAIGVAKKNHSDMLLKMTTLSTAADVAGTPTDNMLEQALHNRRITLQSGVMQAELVVKQLEDVYQQMVDQKMRIDQVINVTLPAYKAAKARS